MSRFSGPSIYGSGDVCLAGRCRPVQPRSYNADNCNRLPENASSATLLKYHMRPFIILGSAVLLASVVALAQERTQDAPPPAPPPFNDWLITLKEEARERGFS